MRKVTTMNLIHKTILISLFIIPICVFAIDSELINSVEILENKEQETVTIDRISILALAIQEFEGDYAGSLARRNNNPGNLRSSPLQSGKRDGFAYFDTYELGMEALEHQIRIGATGESRVYYPEMTLLQFFNTYAPSSDNNQPSKYYQFVLGTTGFTSDMLLRDLL
jgi:hypothetical protein